MLASTIDDARAAVPWLTLTLVILCGLLILDVTLTWWRKHDGIERARQRERDKAAMHDCLERHGYDAPSSRPPARGRGFQ